MERTYSNVSFLEQRIVTLYGLSSNAMKSLDLVTNVMNVENGFHRDDGSDYYTHCVDVANTLLSYGIRDEDVICAGLLHDIIEDVEGYNEITIERLFNSNVARLVMLLTKEHNKDYHKPEYLIAYIENIKKDADASAIKTADRMHNMITLQQKTFESRYRKAMETKTYYIPFFHDCRRMYTRYENLFYAAKAQTEPLIFTIEAMYEEIYKKGKIIKALQEKFNLSDDEITPKALGISEEELSLKNVYATLAPENKE